MRLRHLVGCFFLMLACACAQAQVSEQVEVTGAVQQRLRLDAAGLAVFPADAIGQLTQARNPVGANPPSTVRGVKLAALIGRAGLTPTAR